MNSLYFRSFIFIIISLSLFSRANSHHAFAGVFDMNSMIEVEGEITNILWRNPHVRFSMRDAEGVSWEIESNSLSILRRMDISADVISAGDTVRFAGYSALDGSNAMWVNNALLPDGRELVLRPGVERVWSGEKLGTEEVWLADGTANGNASDRGIFKVWSTHFTGIDRWLWDDEYPMTEAATAAQAEYNMLTDNPIAQCESKGMPWIMEQPYPVEFVQDGEDILFRIEEYDTVRVIHMNDQEPVGVEPSLLGYSMGRWEDNVLVVETAHINYPYFNSTGIRQSTDIKLVERFAPGDDGSRLDYTLVVDDPSIFLEPATFSKAWVWRPGEQVRPYECTNG